MLRHSAGRIGTAHSSDNFGVYGSAKCVSDVGLRCANPTYPYRYPVKTVA